jgi:hypothetical protein
MRMTRRALLGAAVATVTIGLARPAAAQMSPEEILLQLDGLESAYARKYISADPTLGFAMAEAGVATPAAWVEPDQATPDTMLVTVLDFETEADAASAFNTRLNGLTARLLLGDPELSLEERAIDGLGDVAMLYTGVDETGDEPEHVALMGVQDGEYGYLIEAWGVDGSLVKTVEGFGRFMAAAEPGDGPVEVGEYGASGGVFELMPDMGEPEVLHGLVPMYEYDLLLDGGDEPLGHPHDHEDDATPAG